MVLTPEQEARWERAWAGASEFERRRYRSLDAGDRLRVLYLVPAGEAESLGEAVRMASGTFEDFLRTRRRRGTPLPSAEKSKRWPAAPRGLSRL
jgi:hypothetical protein